MEQTSEPSINHARRLLYQIVDLVFKDDGDGASTSRSDSPARQPNVCGTSSRFPPLLSSQARTAPGNTATQSSITEHSRLFGFNSKAGKRGKQSMKNSAVINSSSKKKVVWSRECYCLAGHLHDWVPSSRVKMILAANGLGIKRLDFNKDATSEDIEAIIYDAYPKLIGLGYEFLITDRKSCTLVVIATPAEGMTITKRHRPSIKTVY